MSVTGVVKLFKSEQGYGFIKRDDGGKDVFVHARQLKDSRFEGEPEEGERLAFEYRTASAARVLVNISRM